MTPLVSIIIPLFNAEKHISETIQSALSQTWPAKEVLIIDDGSTDNSLAAARTFESQGIKIFTQTNSGASTARNKGLEEAKGEYIQFLDADDLLPPGKIETQVKLLQENPGCIIGCKWVRFRGNTQNTYGATGPDISLQKDLSPFDWLLTRHMMLVHCWLTPAELIRKAGGWNESLTFNDDGEFFGRVIAQSQKVLYTPDTIAYYRTEHLNNISTLNSRKKCESAYAAAVSFKEVVYRISTDNARAEKVIGNYFQELVYLFYPQYPDLVDKCRSHKEILVAEVRFNASGYTKLLTLFLGWKLAKKIKVILKKTA